MKNILVVDDDSAFRIGTVAMLEDHGFAVSTAAGGDEAQRKIAERPFDLLLTDLMMPVMNGIELLQFVKESTPSMPVIMITGFGSIGTAVEAMRLGAFDYITKPADSNELLIKINRALNEREKDHELNRLRDEVREKYGLENMVGRSQKINEVYALVRQVAHSDVPVLIQGETGTGKELAAKAIHFNSSRRAQPFVIINCSALPESLLESELFGHEKGAFTGAHRQRIGRFEEADGGSIFLDEIGELTLPIQTKLLRVLQEMEIQRVGGNGRIHVNVRVVAATNRDLWKMVSEGSFREDLFYRLNVFPIHMPALRDRLDDLPILVEHLVRKHSALSNSRVKNLSPILLPAMMNYEWKGNIRELENLIRRAIIKTDGETIVALDIPFGTPIVGMPSPGENGAEGDLAFKDYMSKCIQVAESLYLKTVLHQYRGSITTVAEVMGVDRKTVYRIIEKNGIDISEYRPSREQSQEPPG